MYIRQDLALMLERYISSEEWARLVSAFLEDPDLLQDPGLVLVGDKTMLWVHNPILPGGARHG